MELEASLSKTLNMGDYENVKPGFSVRADSEELDGESLEEKMEYLRDMVRDQVEQECADYKKRRSK